MVQVPSFHTLWVKPLGGCPFRSPKLAKLAFDRFLEVLKSLVGESGKAGLIDSEQPLLTGVIGHCGLVVELAGDREWTDTGLQGPEGRCGFEGSHV